MLFNIYLTVVMDEWQIKNWNLKHWEFVAYPVYKQGIYHGIFISFLLVLTILTGLNKAIDLSQF